MSWPERIVAGSKTAPRFNAAIVPNRSGCDPFFRHSAGHLTKQYTAVHTLGHVHR